MFGNKLRHFLDPHLEDIARLIPLSPNTLTVLGFLVTVFASIVLVTDLALGGVLVMVGGIFDLLDGAVARVKKRQTRFGALLDSVLDRYSDAFILLGLGLNLFNHGNTTGMVLCILTLINSFAISYVRARAEGLGRDCKTGIMERPERILFLCFAAITGLVMPVLWILLFLTQLTVLQRMNYVRETMGRK